MPLGEEAGSSVFGPCFSPLGEEAQSLERVFASWTGGVLAEASWRGGQGGRNGPEGAGVTIDKASADFEAQSKVVGITSM